MLTESLVNRGLLAADFCLCSVTTFSMEKSFVVVVVVRSLAASFTDSRYIYSTLARLIVIICYSRAAGLTNIKDEQRQKTLKQYYFSACAVWYGCYAVGGGGQYIVQKLKPSFSYWYDFSVWVCVRFPLATRFLRSFVRSLGQ